MPHQKKNMCSKLERFLQDIHPSKIYGPTEQMVDSAVREFPLSQASMEWFDFIDFVSRFVAAIEGKLYDIPTENLDLPGIRTKYIGYLEKAYGKKGVEIAGSMAKHGHDGGLLRVIQDLRDTIVQDYAQTEIEGRVWSFWPTLTYDEQMAAAQEYLSNYGYLLPQEIRERGAYPLMLHFERFLEQHTRALQILNRVH